MTQLQHTGFINIYNHIAMTYQDMGDLSAKSWVKWSRNEANPMPLMLDRKLKKNSYIVRFDVTDMKAFRALCTAMEHGTKEDTGTSKNRIEVLFNESNNMSTILHDITVLINFNNIMR